MEILMFVLWNERVSKGIGMDPMSFLIKKLKKYLTFKC